MDTLKQRHNSTFELPLALTNPSLEKLGSNSLDCYEDFEDLNGEQISQLLTNLEKIIILPPIFSGYLCPILA